MNHNCLFRFHYRILFRFPLSYGFLLVSLRPFREIMLFRFTIFSLFHPLSWWWVFIVCSQSVAASSSLFLLLSAVAILPRKRKHKKRPNHIINRCTIYHIPYENNLIFSAFSVASTPVSQVSSQGDSMYLPSPRIDNWSPPRNVMDTQMDKTPLLTHVSYFNQTIYLLMLIFMIYIYIYAISKK